jgi:error-prone DNA polymerase
MLTCLQAFGFAQGAQGDRRWILPPSRRRIRDLCDDPPGRHARRLPDREPGADGHAAAAEAPTFYDLVIEVAIVRPGPIQGDMVHPYLRRREGKERSAIPSRNWRRCWARRWACRCFRSRPCGWRSSAPGSRRARPTSCAAPWRPSSSPAGSAKFKDKLVGGMVERGYPQDFAEKTFSQLEGFGSYGFPESHAASFALLAYASSWLKCHHPEVFCAALLNSQPMGFYAARPDRPRRRSSTASRSARSASTPRAGTARWRTAGRIAWPCAWACGWSGPGAKTTRRAWSWRGPTSLTARSTTSGAAPGVKTGALSRLAEADAFLPSLKLARREAAGRSRACATTPCRCSTSQAPANSTSRRPG